MSRELLESHIRIRRAYWLFTGAAFAVIAVAVWLWSGGLWAAFLPGIYAVCAVVSGLSAAEEMRHAYALGQGDTLAELAELARRRTDEEP